MPADPSQPRRGLGRGRAGPRFGPALLVIGLLVAGIGWFAILNAWWVNSDGSAYLSLGFNLSTGMATVFLTAARWRGGAAPSIRCC